MPSKVFLAPCEKHGESKHKNTANGKVCMRCNSARVDKLRRFRKRELVRLFGGKCIECNYDKCVEALEFHHRDPSAKKFQLSMTNLTRSWDVVLQEAVKCDLVCSRCHVEIYVGLRRK